MTGFICNRENTMRLQPIFGKPFHPCFIHATPFHLLSLRAGLSGPARRDYRRADFGLSKLRFVKTGHRTQNPPGLGPLLPSLRRADA